MNAHARPLFEQVRRSTLRKAAHIADPAAKCRSRKPLRGQAGSMLLEAFIAILIFSMGILAIVGMQASAIKNSTEAKYRSEASLLANQLIGKMWVSNRNPATLQTNFQGGAGTDGPMYTDWHTSWCTSTAPVLPACDAYVPTVSVNPASGLVTVTVFWKGPNEAASAAAHNYRVIAQIR